MLPRPAVVLTKINFLLRFALEVDNSARCFDRSSGVDHLPTLSNDDLGPSRARTSSTTDRGCTDALGKVTCPPSPATITHFRPSVSRPSRDL